MRKKTADSEWMVKLLALWSPADEIFNKDYVWHRPKKQTNTQIEYTNADNFWSGLPELSEAEIRGSRRLRIPKAERLRLKMQGVQARRQELEEYEARLLE